MVSLHRGRFVVVHLYSSFPIDSQNFLREAHFYPKLPFFFDFGTVWQHFTSYNGQIWHGSVVLGLPPPGKILWKSIKANLYQKLRFLALFRPGVHLFKISGEIWREGANLGLPPSRQIYTKNAKFWTFWITSAHISHLLCWNLNEPGKN